MKQTPDSNVPASRNRLAVQKLDHAAEYLAAAYPDEDGEAFQILDELAEELLASNRQNHQG